MAALVLKGLHLNRRDTVAPRGNARLSYIPYDTHWQLIVEQTPTSLNILPDSKAVAEMLRDCASDLGTIDFVRECLDDVSIAVFSLKASPSYHEAKAAFDVLCKKIAEEGGPRPLFVSLTADRAGVITVAYASIAHEGLNKQCIEYAMVSKSYFRDTVSYVRSTPALDRDQYVRAVHPYVELIMKKVANMLYIKRPQDGMRARSRMSLPGNSRTWSSRFAQ